MMSVNAQVNYDGDSGHQDDQCNRAVASLAYKIFELLPTKAEIEQLGVFLVLNQGKTPEEAGEICVSLEDSIQSARAALTEAMGIST
jgi:hypothetical protein